MDDVVSHIKLLLGFRMEERRGGGGVATMLLLSIYPQVSLRMAI